MSSFYAFAGDHPVLVFLLANLAGWTIISFVQALRGKS